LVHLRVTKANLEWLQPLGYITDLQTLYLSTRRNRIETQTAHASKTKVYVVHVVVLLGSIPIHQK
jgi:hypothetical protein